MKRDPSLERQHRREALGRMLGITDATVLSRLEAAGIDAGSVVLLQLVPLVYVAWSDGTVAREERQALLAAAATVGVNEGGAGYETLVGWLAQRPGNALFEAGFAAVRALLRGQSPEDQQLRIGTLVGLCEHVARVSGGLLGFARVSREEAAAVALVAAQLEDRHQEAAQQAVLKSTRPGEAAEPRNAPAPAPAKKKKKKKKP